MVGPASAPTGQGSVIGRPDGGRGLRRHRARQADRGDQRRLSAQGRHRRRHRTALVRQRAGRSHRRRAGLGGRTRGAERREGRKKLFIAHSTGAADFHGKFCNPLRIQWVFDTRALAVGTAQEVVKRGGDSWFFITDDYAFGHSLERDATAVINKMGGKVVGGSSRHSRRPTSPPSSCRPRPPRRRSSASRADRRTT